MTMYRYRDFDIRPAIAAEGLAMQVLITSVLLEYGLQPDTDGVDADVLDPDRHYRRDGGEFFSVYRASELVATAGFSRIDGSSAELRKMYLAPGVRGCGLGRYLMQLCETLAHARGFRFMQLETASVLYEAIALYERNAYQRLPGAPHVCRCDRIYRKALTETASQVQDPQQNTQQMQN